MLGLQALCEIAKFTQLLLSFRIVIIKNVFTLYFFLIQLRLKNWSNSSIPFILTFGSRFLFLIPYVVALAFRGLITINSKTVWQFATHKYIHNFCTFNPLKYQRDGRNWKADIPFSKKSQNTLVVNFFANYQVDENVFKVLQRVCLIQPNCRGTFKGLQLHCSALNQQIIPLTSQQIII